MPAEPNSEQKDLFKKEIIWFLALCFISTFGWNAVIFLQEGPYRDGSETWRLALTLEMLIPAVSAVICLLFFRRQRFNRVVWIFFGLFLATAILPVLLKTWLPGNLYAVVQTLLVLATTAVILLFNLNKDWRAQLRPFGLAFDRGLRSFGLLLVFYIFMLAASFALNPLFGLSQVAADLPFGQVAMQSLISVGMVVAGGWFVYFGEEYGWRYYLQHRLVAVLGATRGVLLLGVIWGLWHAPVIAMGYNYPGEPVLGMLMMVLFTVVIGIFYSYAVMKTGSVWPAVILHGANNSIAPLLVAYFGDTPSRVFAFGIGLYGVLFMGLLALWFARQMQRGAISQPAEFSL